MKKEVVRDKMLTNVYMVETICNMMKRGDLSTEYKTQRNPDTWSNEYRDGFISSMIKDEDCDSLKICEQILDDTVNLWIIDGGHRVTALERFRNNAFALGKSLECSVVKYQVFEYDESGKVKKNADGNRISRIEEFDLKGKRYSDLPVELKERFDTKKIDYVKHLNCTDEDIAYHMRRYNKQKSMNPAETSITYMQNQASYLKEVSMNNRFFKDCGSYTPTDRVNGNIDRIVMESVMCVNHIEDWNSGAKVNAKFLNNNSSKEEFEVLGEKLNRLIPLVSEKHDDLFTVKNSFIFITLFDRFTKLGLEDSKFEEFLCELKETLKDVEFEEYDNQTFYEFDKVKATKDTKTVVIKLDMLEKLMMNFLESDIEVVESEEIEEELIEDVVEETVEEIGSTKCVLFNYTDDSSEEEQTVDTLAFIRENVKSDATEDDLVDYIDYFDYISLDVNNSSKLMREENRPSILAVIAYSYKEDIMIDDWFREFFDRENDYLENQVDNYKYMLADMLAYREEADIAAVLQ